MILGPPPRPHPRGGQGAHRVPGRVRAPATPPTPGVGWGAHHVPGMVCALATAASTEC